MILLLSKWVVSVGLQISTKKRLGAKRSLATLRVLCGSSFRFVLQCSNYTNAAHLAFNFRSLSVSPDTSVYRGTFPPQIKLPVVGGKSWKPLRLLPR